MPKTNDRRASLGAYIRAGLHKISERQAKPIRQIAAETGMSTKTARYWLKVDHYDEWLDWWPSADALWAEMVKDTKAQAPLPIDLPGFDPASDDVQ